MNTLLGIAQAFAADPGKIAPDGTAPDSATSSVNLTDFIVKVFSNILLVFGTIMSVAAIVYIMWAAFQYVTSAGSPDKTKTARAALINVIIGIVIFVASFTIVRISLSLGHNILSGL